MGARTFLHRLRDDEQGAYAIEFAVVLPVFLVLTVGALDLGHSLYTKAVLEGALQKAARDSALEGAAAVTESDGSITKARQNAIDADLKTTVLQIQPGADVAITRRTFKDFTTANASHKETFTDANGNSRCDNGETFIDSNGSGVWDTDSGTDGQGDAKDVTIYTATMTYKRPLPTDSLFGMSRDVTLTAKSVLANQPYSEQIAPKTGKCP